MRATNRAGRRGRPPRTGEASAPRVTPWEARVSASVLLDRSREAGARSRVARRPRLLHADQQGVAVAVRPDLDRSLHVPGRLALGPQLLARAAPEPRPA